MLEVNVAGAAAKAGLEAALTHGEAEMVITIVDDVVGDRAHVRDPPAGAIGPVMIETAGTVESAPIVETRAVLGTGLRVDDLVLHS